MSRFTKGRDFPITSICREDLQRKFTKKQIKSLTNSDMEHIASKMADAYLNNGFWIDMPIIVENVLEQKLEQKEA